jgi:hypothetical protein
MRPNQQQQSGVSCARSSGHSELRSRLPDVFSKIGSNTATAGIVRRYLKIADDASLEMVLEGLGADEDDCKQLLSLFSTEAADEEVLTTGRRIGDYAKAEIVAAGPLVTFRPGGKSSSGGGSSSWYTDELIVLMTPWLTVAARSIWLIGQILSELLPGSSSSSMRRPQQQRSEPAHPLHPNAEKVDAGFFKRLLEVAYACVKYLGAQLCHMQLPGDKAAADGSSGAASMPLLTKLLEQHAQLQTGLYLAVQRCAVAGQPAAGTVDICSAGAASLLQHMWGDSLPGQLSAFGAAVAAALPVGWACNNAACTNLAKLSELQLVRGKAKVCGGCKLVRMCSAECQRQHWKAGHKLVCKKLAAAAAAANEPGINSASGGCRNSDSNTPAARSAAAAAAPAGL